MAEQYFAKFPTITYNDKFVKDLSRRLVVEVSRDLPVDLRPYTIREHLRSDQVAEFYYEDPSLDWLIYLVNSVVDPYSHWYMTDSQLANVVASRYGTVEDAKKKVLYYENNWYKTDGFISVSHYEETIPESWKKYYSPVFGVRGEVLRYERKRENTRVNTNRVVDHGVVYTLGDSFVVGEKVDFKREGEDAVRGTAEVVFSNSSLLRIQSVSDDVYANSSSRKDVVGETSGTRAVSSSSNVVHENFSLEEGSFWSPVTAYDVERERNESRRSIRLVDSEVAQLVVNHVEDLLGD